MILTDAGLSTGEDMTPSIGEEAPDLWRKIAQRLDFHRDFADVVVRVRGQRLGGHRDLQALDDEHVFGLGEGQGASIAAGGLQLGFQLFLVNVESLEYWIFGGGFHGFQVKGFIY